MHELSIALSILDMAEDEAHQRGDVAVRAIHLRLGPLSGVVKEALLSAYEMARAEYALDDVPLLIEDVPVRVHCPSCNATRAAVSTQELCCAECGAVTPQVVSGRELEVFALEVQ